MNILKWILKLRKGFEKEFQSRRKTQKKVGKWKTPKLIQSLMIRELVIDRIVQYNFVRVWNAILSNRNETMWKTNFHSYRRRKKSFYFFFHRSDVWNIFMKLFWGTGSHAMANYVNAIPEIDEIFEIFIFAFGYSSRSQNSFSFIVETKARLKFFADR